MLGTTIGNYKVTALLAEGGMGKVYLAEHVALQRKAAIKVLHAGLASDPEVVHRLFVEARAANAIRHPNVVEIHDYGSLPDGSTYIAMEHLEGETLRARLERSPVALGEALDLTRQIASGLAALHGKGVIHRDLKPDNLFLIADPRAPDRTLVKILDFGVAKLREDVDMVSHRTRSGMLIGTPAYMSPEQCLGVKELDAQSDVYSLGVILFQMLCGGLPFESLGVGALIHLHVNVPPPRPGALNARLPRVLEAMILRTLAKPPPDRPSMTELLAWLERQIATLPPALAAVTVRPCPPSPTSSFSSPDAVTTLSAGASQKHRTATGRRGRLGVVVALATLAAAAGAAALLVRRPSTEVPPRLTALVPPAVPPAPRPVSRAIDLAAAPAPRVAPASFDVSLESDPPGATVTADGRDVGTTPLVYPAPAQADPIRFVFARAGYRAEVIRAVPSSGLRLHARLRRAPTPRAAAAGSSGGRDLPKLDDIKSER